MLCIACGAEMRIARIEQDPTMKAAGYEHRRFECVGCQRTERRLAFSGDSTSWPVEFTWALASEQPTSAHPRLRRAKQGGQARHSVASTYKCLTANGDVAGGHPAGAVPRGVGESQNGFRVE
jgi:hypothetical protein